MTDTPAHWVEMAWAARDAAEPDMNAERRQVFDNLRPLILERDLPKSVISPANKALARKFNLA